MDQYKVSIRNSEIWVVHKTLSNFFPLRVRCKINFKITPKSLKEVRNVIQISATCSFCIFKRRSKFSSQNIRAEYYFEIRGSLAPPSPVSPYFRPRLYLNLPNMVTLLYFSTYSRVFTCCLRILLSSPCSFRADQRAQGLTEILTADTIQNEINAEIGRE